jgi:hypothetical protein
MSTSKHPNQPEWGEGDGPPDDLERNPEIGQSAGLTTGAGDISELEADTTVEGDIDNDTKPEGGIRTDQDAEPNRPRS